MSETFAAFLEEARRALQAFDDWASRSNPAASSDHIGYKCANSEEFERLRALFEVPENYVYQSWISGRRIAIIRFAPAVETRLGPISFLELSDQKPDGSQASGFDHIEIFPTQGSVEDLGAWFAARGIEFTKIVRPHHTTYDAVIAPGFKVRIEPERLIEKIKTEEMRS